MRYWSFLVFGRASRVNDHSKKLLVMNKVLEKYSSGYEYVPLTRENLKTYNLIEIAIDEINGKVSVDPY